MLGKESRVGSIKDTVMKFHELPMLRYYMELNLTFFAEKKYSVSEAPEENMFCNTSSRTRSLKSSNVELG